MSMKKNDQKNRNIEFEMSMLDDPLGLKNICLGGDSPSLFSEWEFIKRMNRNKKENKYYD